MLLLASETCLRKGVPWNIFGDIEVKQLFGNHNNSRGVVAKAPGAIS